MGLAKYYVVFAGVNGAGKSTFYHSDAWARAVFPSDMLRVNSDEILREFEGDPLSLNDQMRAMKQAVLQISAFFEAGVSFNQETTLCGKKSLADIRLAKSLGYTVIMFYLGVNSHEIALSRVEHRATLGGHVIPPETVKRRYSTSLTNLREAIGICDEVYLIDNSVKFKLVRSYHNGSISSNLLCPEIVWLP